VERFERLLLELAHASGTSCRAPEEELEDLGSRLGGAPARPWRWQGCPLSTDQQTFTYIGSAHLDQASSASAWLDYDWGLAIIVRRERLRWDGPLARRPWSQPFFGAVTPSCSRSASSTVVRVSTDSERDLSSTCSVMSMSMRTFLDVGAADGRRPSVAARPDGSSLEPSLRAALMPAC
jgi:hypothetical protein